MTSQLVRPGARIASTVVLAVASTVGLIATSASPALALDAARAHVTSVFPDDALTVPDASQLTGERIALPMPDCTASPTDCHDVTLLNQLDGFDLDPRIAFTFDRTVDPAVVASATTLHRAPGTHGGPGAEISVDRVVYDASTHTVYAHPASQLAPDTTYQLRLDGTGENGLPQMRTTFTTESAPSGLLAMRRQLDDGSAFQAAGISPADRGLHVDADVPAAGTTLAYTEDLGSGHTHTVAVPNTSTLDAGRYVFGSFQAPSWLNSDVVIPQTPTAGAGPVVQGSATVPFVLIVPSGTAPAGGWPVAVFGHGFGETSMDMFLAADFNASKGLATIATDVVGHGFGPASTWAITRDGATTTVPAHARGFDQDGNGTITSTEGVSAPIEPSPDAAVASRDGLRQTVADIMTMIRAIGAPTTGADDSLPLRPAGVSYYGQSFGGIYGVMLGGTDPQVPVLAPNVSGGPISEIARLSPSFRLLVTQDLAGRHPSLLNSSSSALAFFDESMPLRGDPPVTNPAPGAIAIQQAIADETWINRSGSPETFAPLLRAAPPAGSVAKKVLFQNAFGDRTVPNPTNYTVLAAGGLFDRESFYRNDLSPNSGSNPHSFLLNPAFTDGSVPGQQQISTFLASGGQTLLDPNQFAPDGNKGVWEVPIANPDEMLDLHFASPLHS